MSKKTKSTKTEKADTQEKLMADLFAWAIRQDYGTRNWPNSICIEEKLANRLRKMQPEMPKVEVAAFKLAPVDIQKVKDEVENSCLTAEGKAAILAALGSK